MSEPFVHLVFVRASAEQVWDALTEAELTGRFWGHSNRSDWQVGSRWDHVRTDGSGVVDVTGTVLTSERPTALEMTFGAPGDDSSVVRFDVEEYRDIASLRITHRGFPPDELEVVRLGWSAVASNLKTLLETGDVLPQAPWEMHAAVRDEQLRRNDPQ